MAKKVTLYIPCFNAQSYIADCIKAALKQTYQPDEILVIDDGSTDTTFQLASGFPVKIIRHNGNKGLACARNTALSQAKNDFIASLDVDCVVEPDWLGKLMQHFTDESVAGVGGKLVEKNNQKLVDKWRCVYMRQHWGDKPVVNPRFLFGSNTVFRKNILIKSGMYNTGYRTNYEDCDMSLKIRAQGYKLVYEPQAVAYHLRSDNLSSLLRTYWRWTFTGTSGIRTPDTFFNLCCKIYDNMVYTWYRIRDDVKEKRCSLLGIDLLVLGSNVFRDIKYYYYLLLNTKFKLCSG